MPSHPIKLVHTSDVHLDSHFSKPSAHHSEGGFRNDAERAFASVVDVAIEEAADVLLIVGDLFDNNRVREEDFEFVYEQLERVSCPVVLTAGNHDVHDEFSVWHRLELSKAGDHVISLVEHAGRSVHLDDIGVSIWGRGMVEHSPENFPLEGAPETCPDGHWHVGLAHGQVVPDRVGIASSQITHREIHDSGFHYLALGHVHVWGDMTQGATTAFYPGSPVAAYASTKGGHVALVTMERESVSVRRCLVDERFP